MEFRQLNASIQNNADSEPDIYMALCMVDSLFKDIRDESGEYIYNCPVGDETLPTKLVWLCRIINKIYANKSDELTRNRTRLDEMKAELAKTEEALEPLAAIPEEIAKAQNKLTERQEELKTRLADKEKWEQLEAKCDEVKRKSEELLRFDPEKAQAELDKLTAEHAKLTQTQTTLTQACIAQEEANKPLRADVAALEADKQRLEQEKAVCTTSVTTLENNLDGLKTEISQLEERAAQLQGEIAQAESEKNSRQQAVDEATATLDGLKADIETLTQKLEEVNGQSIAQTAEIDALRAKIAELEEARQRLEQEKADCTTSVTTLENNLDGLKTEISQLEERAAQLQGEIAQAESEKNSRQQAVDEATTKLNGLKAAAQQLEAEKADLDGKITACNETIADLNAQKVTLQDQLREKEEEKQADTDSVTSLNDSIAGTQADIDDLEQQMKTLQKEHDELVINCEWKKKQITKQRAETEVYRANEFAPAEQRLQNAEEEYQKLLEQKAEKEQTLDRLNTERTNTVTEISLIEGEIEKATAVRDTKAAELENQKAAKEALETELTQLKDTLQTLRNEWETVQTSVQNLKMNDIPNAEAALKTEQEREQAQETKFASLTQEQADLRQKNTQKATELAELKTEVENKDAAYQVLSAKWDANSAELEELNAKLKELEETADSEMLEMRKRRLNADINRLKAIKEETEEKERAIEVQKQALADAQAKKQGLENDLDDLERQTQEIETAIGKLTPMTAQEVREKLASASGQLSTLKAARRQLTKAVETMERALDRDISDEIGLNRLNKDLDALYSSVAEVQNVLKECANSLKLEVH
ncbi:MAG: hypothetical protein LUD78_12630 [Clostridiales bacterium]|nr:hypothetical protein [Clostridiales bacterium]